MHPRQQATERINGRFRLLKKDFSLLFFGLWMQTWIPYTQRVNVGISTSNIVSTGKGSGIVDFFA